MSEKKHDHDKKHTAHGGGHGGAHGRHGGHEEGHEGAPEWLISFADNDRVQPLAYDKSAEQVNERVEVTPTSEAMPVYSNEPPPPQPGG
jgi:hypothetical protein